MHSRRIRRATLCLATALALAGCGREVPQTATVSGNASDTAVLGSNAPGAGSAGQQQGGGLTDARGRPLPPPPIPPRVRGQAVRSDKQSALAVWVQDGRVVASGYTPETGWTPPEPLESIYGESSDPQLASNGNGEAMAVWRHTVGSIRSLRFSRYEGSTGWSEPDVMPGALPQPDVPGAGADPTAPRLRMDAQGHVVAEWPSGFDANEIQSARYVAGEGWSRAESTPVAAVPDPAPAQ